MLHQHWLILTARFHIHWPTRPLLNKYFVPWHTLDSEALHNKFSPWSQDQICCEALCGWALVAGAPPLFCSSWNILRRTPVSLREEGGKKRGRWKRESQEKTSRGLILGLKGESWFQNHYKLGWWVSWGGYKRYSEGERGMAIAPQFLISALYRWRCAENHPYIRNFEMQQCSARTSAEENSSTAAVGQTARLPHQLCSLKLAWRSSSSPHSGPPLTDVGHQGVAMQLPAVTNLLSSEGHLVLSHFFAPPALKFIFQFSEMLQQIFFSLSFPLVTMSLIILFTEGD